MMFGCCVCVDIVICGWATQAGLIVLACPRCGHKAVFHPGMLSSNNNDICLIMDSTDDDAAADAADDDAADDDDSSDSYMCLYHSPMSYSCSDLLVLHHS